MRQRDRRGWRRLHLSALRSPDIHSLAHSARAVPTYDGGMSSISLGLDSVSRGGSHDDEVARLRIPPHSNEAEQSVLGGLLLDNSAWDRAGDLLTDSDFYRHEHKLIYAAIGVLVAEASRRRDHGV